MKKKIVAVLLAALACACVWFAVHATKNIAYAWLCAVICAIGAAVQWRSGCGKNKKNAIMKQQKSQMAPQPTPQPEKPQYAFVRFKVAGTTFDSDGVSRQAMLRKIKFLDPPFDKSDSLDVQLVPVSYNGEPAIECRVNDFLIGYVPKMQIEEVRATFSKPDIRVSAFDVTGGGTLEGEKLNYGAEIVLRYKNKSNEPHETKEAEDVVYVTRDGDMFHANSSCQYIYGKEKTTLSREDAVKQQYKPCKRCYPYARR